MSTDMDCREDLHRFPFVFQQAEFLCVGCNNNHITQQAPRNGLRKGKGGISTQGNEKATKLIPPMKKKKEKSNLLCVELIVDEDDMSDIVNWHAFIHDRVTDHRSSIE